MNKPEALRLAVIGSFRGGLTLNEVQDAENELNRLLAQRDALLGALQNIAECCDKDHAARDYASRQTEIRGIARAAIAAVEGQKA